MPRKLIRFRDLKARDIVRNWPTLKRWIDVPNVAFPPGFKMGLQTRAWFEDDIDAWLEERARQQSQAA